MKIKRRIIHYKLSSALLIIGFVVSFVCYVNCVNLYHMRMVVKKQQTEYRYIDEMTLYCSNQTKTGNSFCPVFDDLEGNLIIKDMDMYRDSAEAFGVTDVIVNQTEPLLYPVGEGQLPEDDTEITEPTIILGKMHKKDAELIDGKYYYKINGVSFWVCAFLDTGNSDLFDYSVILYYNHMPEELQDEINFGEALEAVLCSNRTDVYTQYRKMKECAAQLDKYMLVSALNEEQMEMEQSGSGGINYIFIIMLFCITNSVIVSEYWIKGRYREIAIRELLGYSDEKIYLVLFRDMMRNVVIAVFFALGIEFVIYKSFPDYVSIYISQLGYYALYCLVFIVLLTFVMLIYPFILLKKEDVLKRELSR